jgi:hypothetical protein
MCVLEVRVPIPHFDYFPPGRKPAKWRFAITAEISGSHVFIYPYVETEAELN